MIQRTIEHSFSFNGKGMHSGKDTLVNVKPSGLDNGIIFYRADRNGAHPIESSWVNIDYYPACTQLKNSHGDQVRTVEHFLAACYCCGVSNLYVHVSGDEIPILDGSAHPLVEMIQGAKPVSQGQRKPLLKIIKEVKYKDEHRVFKFLPSEVFEVDINIYPAEYGAMKWSGTLTPEIFADEIIRSRAWGRLKDVWIPKLAGLLTGKQILRGAGLDTAVVYAFGGPINPSAQLFQNDMVRHKVLDIVGDLQLLGMDIQGKIETHSSAHATNHSAMRKLMSSTDAWKIIEP